MLPKIRHDGPIIIHLPIRVNTTSNTGGHWYNKSPRAKKERGLAKAAVQNALWKDMLDPMPSKIVVTFTRFAPRTLDVADNDSSAFKHVKDGVADAIGIDDRSKIYKWKYEQEKSKDYSICIEIVFKRKP